MKSSIFTSLIVAVIFSSSSLAGLEDFCSADSIASGMTEEQAEESCSCMAARAEEEGLTEHLESLSDLDAESRAAEFSEEEKSIIAECFPNSDL